ncbi:MAG: hypothetical protein QHH14_03620 [Clostridiales bacterium]|nr:hypothetical protein [Clostridiales bacterium]
MERNHDDHKKSPRRPGTQPAETAAKSAGVTCAETVPAKRARKFGSSPPDVLGPQKDTAATGKRRLIDNSF